MSSENQIDYDAVIADLIARRDQCVDQFNQAIAAIEAVRGAVSVALTGVSAAGSVGNASAQASSVVKSDSFFGMTVLDAAKKYLAMMRRPLSAPEIAKAIQNGGYLFQTATPVNTVTSVLFRDDQKGGEIVRLGRGQFGLVSWYPSRPKRKPKNEEKEEEIFAANPPPV